MANTDNLGNFIEQGAWDDIAKLETVVESATASIVAMSNAATGFNTELGKLTNLKDLITLTNQAGDANKKVTETVGQLKSGIKLLNEERLRETMLIQDANKWLKLKVAADMSDINTIAGKRAEIQLLTFEYNALDLAKQKDLANSKRAELDAKNAVLKGSVDSYTAQKINIGNYPEAMAQATALRSELDMLAASGQKDSAEFVNLSSKLTDLTSSMTSFTSSAAGMGGRLTAITGEMEQLAAAGQMDSAEFKHLAAEAAELKVQMAQVGVAIKEAGMNAERGAVAMEKFAETMKEIGKFAIMFFGITAGMEFIAGISEEFGKADKAARQLKNTLENVGGANLFGKLTEDAEKFADKFSYLDTYEVQNVFSKLITYGKLTEDQINEAMPVIIDFAAKTGKSLEESAGVIIKALEGSSKGLKEFGINIKDAKTATGEAMPQAERFGFIMDQLKPRVAGAGEAMKNSWEGMIGTMKKNVREMELAIADFIVKISGVEEANHKAAVAAKKEADEGDKLIKQYTELSKKVNQTTKDKSDLRDIVQKVADIFGQSVIQIDKETNSLKLNLDKTKELITQRRLLANADAANEAAKYNAAKMNKEAAEEEFKKAAIQQKQLEEKTGETAIQAQGKMTYSKGGRLISNLTPSEEDLLHAKGNLELQKQIIDKSDKQMEESLNKLAEYNFTKDQLDKLLDVSHAKITNPPPPPGGEKPYKGYIVENFKAMSAEMFAQYKIETEQKRDHEKEMMDVESESYEKRKAALLAFQNYQHQLNQGEILQKYRDQEFENKNREQKPKESDESFAQRQAIGLQKIETLQKELNALTVTDKKATTDALKELDSKYVDYQLGLMKQLDDKIKSNEGVELNNEKIRYEKGLIDKEAYDKNTEQISQKYKRAELIANKSFLEQLKKQAQAYGIDTTKVDAALQANQTEINNLPSSKKETNSIGLTDEEWKNAQAIANGIMSLEAQVMKAVDQRYAAEIAALEHKRQLIDDNYAAEINAIQGSFRSQVSKDRDIAALKAQQAIADKAANDEILRMKRKQAEADKVAAIASAIEKGAVAVVNALDSAPAPYNFILAAAVGAAAAVEIGIISSTPLPQYGEGTEGLPGGVHPGGDAIVGELNKPEYILRPGSKNAEMVNRATRLNLERGTRVLTEEQMMNDSSDLLPESMLHLSNLQIGLEGVLMGGISDLKDEISDLKEVVRNKRENYISITGAGIKRQSREGNTWTEYIESNFK